MFEIKMSMEGFNNRLDTVAKRINELKDSWGNYPECNEEE